MRGDEMKKGTGWEQVSYRDVQDANEMRMRETAKCLKNLKSLMQKINREKCDPEGEKDMAEEKKNQDDMNNEMTFEERQYERLINARNFHYENLNKWLMSFYVIIGALFLALYTLHGNGNHHVMELCVAIVGYMVSIAALLSGKGYYYWETNWIMLVHHFEKIHFAKKEERIYSIFANSNANNSVCSPLIGANVSTSKVMLTLTACIAVLWGTISTYMAIQLLPKLGIELPPSLVYYWLFVSLAC